MSDPVSTSPLNAAFQPDPAHMYSDELRYILDQRFLARIVGLIALCLPFALAIDGWQSACFFNSVSHFYYSRYLGAGFVLAMGVAGTFLIAYRGETRLESALASFAGVAAFLVAFFPTSGTGCEANGHQARAFVSVGSEPGPIELTSPLDGGFFTYLPSSFWIHLVAAGALFAVLAFFALVVFTRVIPERHLDKNGALCPNKRTRNALYHASGFMILTSIAALVANAIWGAPRGSINPWDQANATFIFEALALFAFGFSWMLKARFFGTWLVDENEAHSMT